MVRPRTIFTIFLLIGAIIEDCERCAAQTQTPFYQVSPDHWPRGKTFDVTITDSHCPPASAGTLNNSAFAIPAGFGVNPDTTIETAVDTACTKVVRVKVDEGAQLGDLPVRLDWKDQSGKITQSTTMRVTIVDAVPGPIPPGLTPQVDVMWYVMPEGIARDNYGHKIGKEYYAIDAAIGNNSGYDLLVSALGFSLPLRNGVIELKLPSTSYRVARATLEKEQQVGVRAIVINTVRALGPIGTGIVPFFHAPGPKANFTQGVDLFSNPLEKGLELVWPDSTLRQLNNLDDEILRDGTIIHNNDQIRTRVFIPKALVRSIAGVSTATPATNSCSETSKSTNRTYKVSVAECNELNTVSGILAKMVLIGSTIQYLNRVHVAAGATGTATAPPAISDIDVKSFAPGAKDVAVKITGANLQGGTFTASSGKIHISNVVIDDSGRSATLNLTVDDTVAEGPYSLTVKTSAGTAQVPLTVKEQSQ